jgi:hypothetical protein
MQYSWKSFGTRVLLLLLLCCRLNAMNEIWVPSEWQRESFAASGVAADKLRVVPEVRQRLLGEKDSSSSSAAAAVAASCSHGSRETHTVHIQTYGLMQPQTHGLDTVVLRAALTHHYLPAILRDLLLLLLYAQGVNTTWFDPAQYTPLPLQEKAQLVFGKPWADKQQQQQQQQQLASNTSIASSRDAIPSSSRDITGKPRTIAGNDTPDTRSSSSSGSSSSSKGSQPRKPFVFISAFKWELRKGWDVLLQAYLSEFTADDDVELYILTKPFGDSGSGFKEKISSWADKMHQDEVRSKASSSSSKPSTADTSMALVQAAASGRFPPLVPVSAAAVAASPAVDVLSSADDAKEFGSKAGPARKLQGLNGQQQLADESTGSGAGASASVHGVAARQTKAYAQHVAQEIRQFSWRNITAASQRPLQQRRRTLLQDSKHESTAAAAAHPTAAEAQLARAQQQQQQQDADPAAAAAAAAARYPTLYVVDSHISGAAASMALSTACEAMPPLQQAEVYCLCSQKTPD